MNESDNHEKYLSLDHAGDVENEFAIKLNPGTGEREIQTKDIKSRIIRAIAEASAQIGDVTSLSADYIKATYVKATYVKATYVKATYIKATYVKATYVKATYIKATYIKATYIKSWL